MGVRLPARNLSLGAEVLAELFDHAPDLAFLIKDGAGRYLAVNESLIKRHGYRHKSQVLGRRPCDICPGELGRLPADQDARVLRTGRPLLDHLEQQWYLPRRPVWCLTTKLPLRDATGKIIGIVGTSRDVRAPMDPRSIPGELATVSERFENNLAETVTPTTLARRARLTPAKFARLLRETDKGVSEVAHECGFYDYSAFTRAFHSAMGVTPSAYREATRKTPLPD